jgi:hypothetical protein
MSSFPFSPDPLPQAASQELQVQQLPFHPGDAVSKHPVPCPLQFLFALLPFFFLFYIKEESLQSVALAA